MIGLSGSTTASVAADDIVLLLKAGKTNLLRTLSPLCDQVGHENVAMRSYEADAAMPETSHNADSCLYRAVGFRIVVGPDSLIYLDGTFNPLHAMVFTSLGLVWGDLLDALTHERMTRRAYDLISQSVSSAALRPFKIV